MFSILGVSSARSCCSNGTYESQIIKGGVALDTITGVALLALATLSLLHLGPQLAPWVEYTLLGLGTAQIVAPLIVCLEVIWGKSNTEERGFKKTRAPRYYRTGTAKSLYHLDRKPGYIYYTPASNFVEGVFGFNKRKIQQEVRIGKKIKQRIIDSGDDENLLALDYKEVKESKRIKGRYTARVPRALGDLNEFMRDQTLSWEDKVTLVEGFLKGLATLHKAGFVHGDLKPENLLVYVNMLVKLADFEKAREVKKDETLFYTGNPRFASPKKKLSQKEEVYIAALIIISVLEKEFLGEGDMLIQPTEEDPYIKPQDKRSGIERFLILSKVMPQTEALTFRGKVRAFGPSFLSTRVDLAAAQKELSRYIDALTDKLEEPQKGPLNALLKRMTLLESASQRPSMEEVFLKFKSIFT